MTAVERLLNYVGTDTTSDENSEDYPSTPNQKVLAARLASEMKAMGVLDVRTDSFGYVTGTIPGNVLHAPVLGLLAHMDTSPASSGGPIHPRILLYEEGDIVLNEEKKIVMRKEAFPFLETCKGKHLVLTDGTTLLGADDKAGISEIMTLAERLLTHPEIPHGDIRIGFTPDEEIGAGVKYFDVKAFGADIAYTVDGGPIGEIEYENFNAGSARVTCHGVSVHTGSAKNKMVNALLVAHEFQSMMPGAEIPEHTEGYEGFFHLRKVEGGVEECRMTYNIREHDTKKYEERKTVLIRIAHYLNEKFGQGTVELEIKDSLRNMKDVMRDHMDLIEKAKEAFRRCNICASTPPIRGGTDGARLSFMGLPCPNLSTGGYNFHGRYECIPVESMDAMVDVLTELVQLVAEK